MSQFFKLYYVTHRRHHPYGPNIRFALVRLLSSFVLSSPSRHARVETTPNPLDATSPLVDDDVFQRKTTCYVMNARLTTIARLLAMRGSNCQCWWCCGSKSNACASHFVNTNRESTDTASVVVVIHYTYISIDLLWCVFACSHTLSSATTCARIIYPAWTGEIESRAQCPQPGDGLGRSVGQLMAFERSTHSNTECDATSFGTWSRK